MRESVLVRPARGTGWYIGIVMLLALVAGIFAFNENDHAGGSHDLALARAANDVGGAARPAGGATAPGN